MRRGIGEYPPGWAEFTLKLKEDSGWKCERCGAPNDYESGHVLTVHHLTMNKAEPFEHWYAFAVLCQRCHLHIQAKVVMERFWFLPHSTWFKPHVAGYYAQLLGLPYSRIYITENSDEIIQEYRNKVLDDCHAPAPVPGR